MRKKATHAKFEKLKKVYGLANPKHIKQRIVLRYLQAIAKHVIPPGAIEHGLLQACSEKFNVCNDYIIESKKVA